MAEAKSSKTTLFVAFAVGLALMGGLAYLLTNIKGNKDVSGVYTAKYVEITEQTNDPEHWAKNYPRQYASFAKTQETGTIKTPFGGNAREDKLKKYPDYVRIWGGKMPFAVDYASARGHHYAMIDQAIETKRNQPPFKQPGACAHCHTGDWNKLVAEIGVDNVTKTPYKELYDTGKISKKGVVCADCHDPKTNDLRITRPGLVNALQEHGVDWKKASRNEMRSLVCAQCHVEYYFKGDNKSVVFPWANGKNLVDGMKLENQYDYYTKIGFSDFKHGETGAPMLKAQHPEYELNAYGLHAQSGVSCADCHMPYMRDGNVKVTDHWVRTPLDNINGTCMQCHRGQSEAQIYERVVNIQTKNKELLRAAEKALVSAIDAINAAKAGGATDAQLAATFELQRKGTFFWDYIAMDNSIGFHAPQEAARIVGKAIDFARQAEIEAMKLKASPVAAVVTSSAVQPSGQK